MNVKIDTKEKFTVLTPNAEALTANMTENLLELLRDHQNKNEAHIILNLLEVKDIAPQIANSISEVQQSFYNNKLSFVVCCLQEKVKKVFEKEDLLDFLNYTPTESEAWDILQMEEIERELLNGEE